MASNDAQLTGVSSARIAEYHAGIDTEVKRAFAELDAMFAELRLQRRQRLAQTAAEGREKLEKEAHARLLARLEKSRQTQVEKERLDRERWQREKEADETRRRDEEQRKLHSEQAAKAQKEDAERKARIEAARKSADAAETKAKSAAATAASEEQQRAQAAGSASSSPFTFNTTQKPAAKPVPGQSSQQTAPASTTTSAATNTSGVSSTAAKPPAPSASSHSSGAKSGERLSTDWDRVTTEFQAGLERIAWIRENVKLQMKQQPKEVQDRVRDIQSDLRARFGMLTDSKRKLLEVREVVRAHFTEVKQSGNSVAYMAILNAFAKLLVSQGEAEAQKTIERALPLAMLTVLLWDEFRDLGDFVIPRFIKKCPQVIGFSCPISTEEGRKRMGWKRDGGSQRYESEERYCERISGICSVWSAMTQSKMSKTKQTLHPYPITHSWIFLARHLNRPKPEVTAADYAAVGAWWDMTAMRFQEAFGKQADKLLTATWDAWTDDRMEFPALRLRGLGEDWQSTGKLEHAWKPLAP